MFDFHEKRKIRTWLYSRITIVLILVLAGFVSMSAFKRYQVEREMAERRDVAESELQALEDRAATLEEKVDHLENQRGLEEEIRTRFDVAREGEQVVIILDNEDTVESSDEVVQVTDEPWYKFW